MSRLRLTLFCAVVGMSLPTLGCDAAARSEILRGAENAASTLGSSLIRALFQSIGGQAVDEPVNTVKARTLSQYRHASADGRPPM